MFKEDYGQGQSKHILEKYIEQKPERLEQFQKDLGGFSIEKLKSFCEQDSHFSEKFREVIAYATAYTEKIVRMEELQGCVFHDTKCEAEFEKLVREQSMDKDLFMKSLGELHEDIIKTEKINSDFLSPLLGRSSVFNSQLALYFAFLSINI